MSRILNNVPNTDGPSSDYPAGKIRNKDGLSLPPVIGTPIVEEVYGDIVQFFQKLLALATITPNNLPDNESNGYQLLQALNVRINTLIDFAITGLVNSAPSTLDTLKELADAMGDDANFAATVMAALGNKADGAATLIAINNAQTNANAYPDYATGGVLTKIVNIGDWDMDSVNSVNVVHGLVASKIRSVHACIRPDSGALFGMLGYNLICGGFSSNVTGSIGWDNTLISLGRIAGGFFDSVDFNSTSWNRGWVEIRYVA